jgi:hypothetical protein
VWDVTKLRDGPRTVLSLERPITALVAVAKHGIGTTRSLLAGTETGAVAIVEARVPNWSEADYDDLPPQHGAPVAQALAVLGGRMALTTATNGSVRVRGRKTGGRTLAHAHERRVLPFAPPRPQAWIIKPNDPADSHELLPAGRDRGTAPPCAHVGCGRVAVVVGDAAVQLWSLQREGPPREGLRLARPDEGAAVTALARGGHDDVLLVGRVTGALEVWRVSNGACLLHTKWGDAPVRCLAYVGDGRVAAATGDGGGGFVRAGSLVAAGGAGAEFKHGK